MNLKHYCLLFLLPFVALGSSAQQNTTQQTQKEVIEGHGNLFVLHNPDKSIRIVAANREGEITERTFASIPENLLLHYYAADSLTQVDFTFSIRPAVQNKPYRSLPKKILAVSDLHGRLDAFAALLIGNGVVDKEFRWSYGKNALVIVGDIFDRGRDDNGIAWLIYKLQYEAQQKGGRVDFLPGNHEDLVLKNDLRYLHPSNRAFADKLGIAFAQLYGTGSELGRWIRRLPLTLVAGENLFVHAGISHQMLKEGYSFEEMNQLYSQYVGYPTSKRGELNPRNETLFGNKGPLWYRGMVVDSENHPAITDQALNEILAHYNVKRVIVGHSEVDNVEYRYNGKVIAVNVRHYKNLHQNSSAGLLIEKKKLFSVDYRGNKSLLSK